WASRMEPGKVPTIGVICCSTKAARPGSIARVGDRRRRARLLEGGWRGLAEDARSTLLGAQDRQCAGQATEGQTTESQARLAGDLDGGDPERCRDRLRRLHPEL